MYIYRQRIEYVLSNNNKKKVKEMKKNNKKIFEWLLLFEG